MEKSIREMIGEYQNEILKGDLLPGRAAEILTEISALLGNINDKIIENDVIYNKVLLNYLDSEQTANRARIRANITEEYKEMRNARNTEKVAVEIIRGLKFYLKARGEEYKAGRNL